MHTRNVQAIEEETSLSQSTNMRKLLTITASQTLKVKTERYRASLSSQSKRSLSRRRAAPQVALPGPSTAVQGWVLLSSPSQLLFHRPPSEGRCECSGLRGPKWPQLYIEDVPQMRAAGPLTPPMPSGGTTGRLCDWQVLGKGLGSPSRGLLSLYWLVEASAFSTFGSSGSRLPYQKCGKVFLPNHEGKPSNTPHQSPTNTENSVALHIKIPTNTEFLVLKFPQQDPRKAKKECFSECSGKEPSPPGTDSLQKDAGQAARQVQDWYAGPTRASSSCGPHPCWGSTQNWSISVCRDGHCLSVFTSGPWP